jgi:hypothetical protein
VKQSKFLIAVFSIPLLAGVALGQSVNQVPNRLIHPFESREQVESFLRTADIIKAERTSQGITLPIRLTLSDGRRQCHATFKSIDEHKRGITQLSGSTEYDFKDSWKYEVAAYELDKLLGLDMVPVTVMRTYNTRRGSLQFWVEDCMDEGERRKKKLEPPNPVYWNWQIITARLFDRLLYNIDRNLGNLLITPDWKLVLIDHSRTFKNVDYLKSPEGMQYFSRSLMDRLAGLDKEIVEQCCGDYLTSFEIESMLKRRDRIMEIYRRLVKEKGRGIAFP